MKNKTLTKNMPNVKWDRLPQRKGPNPQGIVICKNKKNNGAKISRKVLPNKRND